MYSAENRHQTPLKIAEPEPLSDIAPALPKGEGLFLGRLSRGAGGLRRWLSRASDDRRAHLDEEPLDDHTLSDIGMPRIEQLYWDPK